MKTRPDFTQVKHNVLVNLKTDIDANPDTWMRHKVFNLDYPMQAIVEIEGAIRSGLMDTVDHYYWLVVEKNPPTVLRSMNWRRATSRYCVMAAGPHHAQRNKWTVGIHRPGRQSARHYRTSDTGMVPGLSNITYEEYGISKNIVAASTYEKWREETKRRTSDTIQPRQTASRASRSP